MTNFYQIGTRVKLRHTGSEGVVCSAEDAESIVMVRLMGDREEIPVFTEDLMGLAEVFVPKSKVAPPAAPTEPASNILVARVVQQKENCAFAFEPIYNSLGDAVLYYKVFLLNQTYADFLCKIKLTNRAQIIFEKEDFVGSESGLLCGQMPYDALNEQPEIQFSCQKIGVKGAEQMVEKTLRIKVNTFFRNLTELDSFHIPVHRLIILDYPEKSNLSKSPAFDDLKTYTQQQIRASREVKYAFPEKLSPSRAKHQVRDLAHFNNEIDLHIENLTATHEKMSNGDMVRLQMLHFERFLDRAIQLGVARIFVIHGVGKGKLRDLIASSLLQNRNVTTFKNEFHHRYGFGATEVILE